MKILKNKIMLSVWIFSLLILTVLYFFIPYVTEKNIDTMIVDNSKRMVEQVKLTRTYYLNNIVSKIKNQKTNFNFVANHHENKHTLPLPSTLVHDLGKIFTKKTGIGFRTYSNFPFKNRQDRILSDHDKEVLSRISQTKDGLYVSKVIVNNESILKIAVADYMEQACVNCHNHHPDRTWADNKWKVGDIRGVIEISTPLTKPIAQIKHIKQSILWSMGMLFSLLILYYSWLFLRREDELLNMNELLDKRVAIEMEKNKEKEQILIQKSKLSSLGEMLANIAHQWRQPLSELSTLLMNIDIRYQNNNLDKEFMDKKMQKSEKLLDYLSYTIDDFQNFFKLEKSKSNFNLGKVIKSTLNISNIHTNENISVILDVDDTLNIYGYQTELSQVLLNIISNAKEALLSHETSNAFIKISTFSKDHKIHIYIEDNAGGIAKEHIKQVFDLYYSHNKNDGSGIGLYMSKLIIEKHFLGQITVHNTNDGAVFSLILPQS